MVGRGIGTHQVLFMLPGRRGVTAECGRLSTTDGLAPGDTWHQNSGEGGVSASRSTCQGIERAMLSCYRDTVLLCTARRGFQ